MEFKYRIMQYPNRNNFIFFFTNFIILISFFYFIALAKSSDIKLLKNGENWTYCVILDFIEYVLIFYPFCKHWLQSSNYALLPFFYSHFLHGFYQEGMFTFVKIHFCNNYTHDVVSFLNSVHVLNHSCQFAYIEPVFDHLNEISLILVYDPLMCFCLQFMWNYENVTVFVH